MPVQTEMQRPTDIDADVHVDTNADRNVEIDADRLSTASEQSPVQIDSRLQVSDHCELSDQLLMKIDSRLQLRDHLQLSHEVCARAVDTACIPPSSLLEL